MKLTKDRLINMRLKEIIEFRYLDECKKTTDFAKKTDKLFGTAHVTISPVSYTHLTLPTN